MSPPDLANTFYRLVDQIDAGARAFTAMSRFVFSEGCGELAR